MVNNGQKSKREHALKAILRESNKYPNPLKMGPGKQVRIPRGHRVNSLRQRIYNVIRDDDQDNLASNIYDIALGALILVNVFFIVFDTFEMTPSWYDSAAFIVERTTMVVFTIEYLLRIWVAPLAYPHLNSAKARLRYIVSFMAIIDILSILPFYLPLIFPADFIALRLLRVIKLVRLFKITRLNDSLDTISTVLKKRQALLISSLVAITFLMVISSVLIYSLEHRTQPEVFKNAADGLWWTFSTITSANMGDIYPITFGGRIFTLIVSLLGVGLFAVPTGIITAGFMEESSVKEKHGSLSYEIRELDKLLKDGLLTKDEFQQQKIKVLQAQKGVPKNPEKAVE